MHACKKDEGPIASLSGGVFLLDGCRAAASASKVRPRYARNISNHSEEMNPCLLSKFALRYAREA
jgi:hypothetical protein